jgi:hypothetical protein
MKAVIGFCPHCGNSAPQTLLFRHQYTTVGYSGDGIKDEGPPSTYYAAECGTCGDLLLYHSFGDEHSEHSYSDADLMYPKSVDLPTSVPDTVRACYAEAGRIQNAAPNAYAVMIRRALEALCDDRGAIKGSLIRRLANLVSKGEIPPTLAEMTTVLRLLGNVGAHDTSQSVTVPQTWSMDEFFRAVIEYVYVAPSRLAKFKSELEKTDARSRPRA